MSSFNELILLHNMKKYLLNFSLFAGILVCGMVFSASSSVTPPPVGVGVPVGGEYSGKVSTDSADVLRQFDALVNYLNQQISFNPNPLAFAEEIAKEVSVTDLQMSAPAAAVVSLKSSLTPVMQKVWCFKPAGKICKSVSGVNLCGKCLGGSWTFSVAKDNGNECLLSVRMLGAGFNGTSRRTIFKPEAFSFYNSGGTGVCTARLPSISLGSKSFGKTGGLSASLMIEYGVPGSSGQTPIKITKTAFSFNIGNPRALTDTEKEKLISEILAD